MPALSNVDSDGNTIAGVSGSRWAVIMAMLFGVAGSALVCLALIIDNFVGKPGFGTVQWAMLLTGLFLVLFATAMRYLLLGALREGLGFVTILAQAALLLAVVQIYQIETPIFHNLIFAMVVTGFVAQHFFPEHLRLWLFVTLSVIGMLAALGPIEGTLLLAVGLALIGVCHIPIPLVARVGILLAAGAALAIVRAGATPFDRLETILPILGSIFMFRLAVYLYDMKTGKVPASRAARLSYFFMLPNFAFPFFPVIDQSTWQRSYQTAPSLETYQRGLVWMQIGIAHLLLYRFVNYHIAFDPADVAGFWMFLYYCFANFGLYLKISGLFHLILGCLFLFGFAMPETHSRYYLSFSFVEFWRRINIYWKDFMQKMVFNPVFTWAKRQGFQHLNAIVIAIAAVFFSTWVLHAYQWFWLRGTLLFSAPDVLFWLALGVFLVIQTVHDSRPTLQGRWSLIGPSAFKALRTVATMTTLVVLWSMWSSESMIEWFFLLGRSGLTLLNPLSQGTLSDYLSSALFLTFLAVIVALSLGYTFGLVSAPQPAGGRGVVGRRPGFERGRHALMTCGICAALIAPQVPTVKALLPISARVLADDMATVRLSTREQAKVERGYYENLTDVRIANSDLLLMRQIGATKDFDELPMVNRLDNYLHYVLKPNFVGQIEGATLSTNAMGLRDREYSIATPPGKRRVALVGDSRAMGMGVGDNETFENLVEDSLNARLGGKIEVLNFGVAGYDVMQKTLSLDRVISEFKPEIVLYLAHNADLELRRRNAVQIGKGVRPGDFVNPIIMSSGVETGMAPEAILEILNGYLSDIAEASYAEFVRKAHAGGALPVWIYLPSTERYPEPLPQDRELRELAQSAGFVTIDLYDIYNSVEGDITRLWISDGDDHPNAEGHRLIAQRLEAEILARPEIMQILDPH
jgi:lysophospholipase L1-like esterase